MGVQLIFVVETNKKCNSDWIYIKDTQKKNEAATFKAKKLIMQVNPKRLSEKSYRNNTSNILEVLDQYPELTRKIRG